MFRVHFLLAPLAAASVAGCGGGGDSNQPSDATPPPNRVSIVAGAETRGTNAFIPNPFTRSLADGSTVQWFNDDRGRDDGYGGTIGGVTHNITADDASFSSGNLAPGGTFEAAFGVTGTYGYHCSIHPAMRGTVMITP